MHKIVSFLVTCTVVLMLGLTLVGCDNSTDDDVEYANKESNSNNLAPGQSGSASSQMPNNNNAGANTSNNSGNLGNSSAEPANIGDDSEPTMAIPHNTGTPTQYASGEIADNEYVNESVGFACSFPPNYDDNTVEAKSSVEAMELALVNKRERSAIEIMYGCETDDAPVAVLVASHYAAEQDNVGTDKLYSSVELGSAEIAGQRSYVIFSQRLSDGLCQAMGYYEHNGHVMMIKTIAPTREAAADLFSNITELV